MTESAAAAKWRCALLQTVVGYVRTAPGPLNKTLDKLKSMMMSSLVDVVRSFVCSTSSFRMSVGRLFDILVVFRSAVDGLIQRVR